VVVVEWRGKAEDGDEEEEEEEEAKEVDETAVDKGEIKVIVADQERRLICCRLS